MIFKSVLSTFNESSETYPKTIDVLNPNVVKRRVYEKN